MAVAPAAFAAQTEGEIAPAAAGTAKTFLNVIAPANTGYRLTELGIAFVGTVAAAKPVLVELCTSTQGTAGTSTAVTLRPVNPATPITATATARKDYSVEPATLVPVREWLVHPQAPLIVQFPLGREPWAVNGNALALRVTFATAETLASARAYFELEE